MNQQTLNISTSNVRDVAASTNGTSPAAVLNHILILPRRLWLDTPDVAATVPMLRGTWGAALHDLDRLAYTAVFGGDEGNGSANGPVRSDQSPPGYLMRPAPPDPRLAPAVDFILFGQAPQHNDACRLAWQEAARRGLGPNRRPFNIRAAFHISPDGAVRQDHHWLGPTGDGPLATDAWPLSHAVWLFDAAEPCRLVFSAPLRIRRGGRLVEQPKLADIVVAACRRIEAFLPEPLKTAWKDYSATALELARSTSQSPWQGARLDLHRWSARQQSELDMHGVTGALTLPNGPGDLASLLAAAQWLHLGKGTVMGLGQMEVWRGDE